MYKKDNYKNFLKSSYWKNYRIELIKSRGAKCQFCGAEGWMNIHHSSYDGYKNEREHPELMIILCKKCHDWVHADFKLRKRVRINGKRIEVHEYPRDPHKMELIPDESYSITPWPNEIFDYPAQIRSWGVETTGTNNFRSRVQAFIDKTPRIRRNFVNLRPGKSPKIPPKN